MGSGVHDHPGISGMVSENFTFKHIFSKRRSQTPIGIGAQTYLAPLAICVNSLITSVKLLTSAMILFRTDQDEEVERNKKYIFMLEQVRRTVMTNHNN